MHSKPDRRQQVGEFFAANDGKLYRAVARSITAPRALIDDACANAWVTLLRRPDITLDRRGLCWLTTVASNEALLLLRRTRGETPVGTFQGSPGGHDDDVREPGGDTPADEWALARIEHAERVEAFRQLEPREREALYLKALGYSYNEIAALSGADGFDLRGVNRRIPEGRAVPRGRTGARRGPPARAAVGGECLR